MSNNGTQIKQELLRVIEAESATGLPNQNLQSSAILRRVADTLNIRGNAEQEQVLLTMLHDLFRTGHLAWGFNIGNPDPPFFHVTHQGSNALKNFSRDPANPVGYMSHLNERVTLNSTALSYISEALQAYNCDCIKATAVMVGCAAESIGLEVRDALIARLDTLGETPQKNLTSWQIGNVLNAIDQKIVGKKADMPYPLWERYVAHWSSFTGQIRIARNDAGHPKSVDPTFETVHASLLIFPELAVLAHDLIAWIQTMV